MSKQHFLGSRDSADSFTKYTYLNEGDAACIRVDTESWSGCDVDSVKLGEHSKSYLLSKPLLMNHVRERLENGQLILSILKSEHVRKNGILTVSRCFSAK